MQSHGVNFAGALFSTSGLLLGRHHCDWLWSPDHALNEKHRDEGCDERSTGKNHDGVRSDRESQRDSSFVEKPGRPAGIAPIRRLRQILD